MIRLPCCDRTLGVASDAAGRGPVMADHSGETLRNLVNGIPIKLAFTGP
jgi:hypothetical protein